MKPFSLTISLIVSYVFLATFYPAFSYSDEITGIVFRDHNHNGVLDPGEPGVSSITLVAYDSTNHELAKTTTDINGSYALENIPSGISTRVDMYWDRMEQSWIQAGIFGSASSSRVRFVDSNATNINFAVVNPADYCEGSASILSSRYLIGDQLAADPLIISFSETSGAASGAPIGNFSLPAFTSEAIASDIGTVYGLAYRSISNDIFAGAFVKRHSALGPTSNPTTIYRVNRNTGEAEEWLTLDPVRTDPHTTSPAVTAAECPNCDASILPVTGFRIDTGVYPQIFKEGLGDLELSEDQSTLYTIDLGTRSLVSIPIIDDSLPGTFTSNDLIASIGTDILENCPEEDDIRPFGLGVYDGKVYIGLVCSAQSTASPAAFPYNEPLQAGPTYCTSTAPPVPFAWCSADTRFLSPLPPAFPLIDRPGDANILRGYVYSWNEADGFEEELDFSLNYERGCLIDEPNCGDYQSADWAPWVDEYPHNAAVERWYHGVSGSPWETLNPYWGKRGYYPQPAISDIEFDLDGNMIIGITDRMSHSIGGSGTMSPLVDGMVVEAQSSGEILRACGNPTNGWILEEQISGDGSCSTPGTSSMDSGSIVLNEYYFQDGESLNGPDWKEHTLGGLAQIRSRDTVITNGVDVAYDTTASQNEWNGGVSWLNNTTGAWEKAYIIYSGTPDNTNNLFGEAAGIGDIEAICPVPPIEIGNRVWFDLDGDGIQDPGEPPIPGVTVSLYASDFTLVASVVTDNEGQYLFSSQNNISTTSFAYNLNINSAGGYEIRLDNPADYESGGVLENFIVTEPFDIQASTGGSSLNDSNGTLTFTNRNPGPDNYPSSQVATQGAAANNHSYDFGFTLQQLNLASILNSFDSSGQELVQLAAKARKNQKRSSKKFGCKRFSNQQSSSHEDNVTDTQLQFWQNLWILDSITYELNSIPPYCSATDNSAQITIATALFEDLKDLAKSPIRGKCYTQLSSAKKTKKRIRRTYKKARNSFLADYPSTTISCNLS